jgi:ketosteroid isomerase-like protein
MANPISERPLPALIDDLANAIRAKDVNAVMTYYAADVLASYRVITAKGGTD